VTTVKGRVNAAGGAPEAAVLHYKPGASLFRRQANTTPRSPTGSCLPGVAGPRISAQNATEPNAARLHDLILHACEELPTRQPGPPHLCHPAPGQSRGRGTQSR
jgi:hypothetical protein